MSINTIKKTIQCLTIFLFSGRKTVFYVFRSAPSLPIFIIPVARTNGETHNWNTHKSGPYCNVIITATSTMSVVTTITQSFSSVVFLEFSQFIVLQISDLYVSESKEEVVSSVIALSTWIPRWIIHFINHGGSSLSQYSVFSCHSSRLLPSSVWTTISW